RHTRSKRDWSSDVCSSDLNLERHVNNVRNHYGLPCVVSINHFQFDTAAEIALLQKKMAHHEAPVILADHWARGGKGAEDLAHAEIGRASCRERGWVAGRAG